MIDSVDVAVLGAGPAGLMAALRLARSGRRVVVLEQSGRVGGLAGSFHVAGVRVDHGSHRLHPSCAPEILADLRDLLGDDLQRRARCGRIRLGGRWVGFPPRASDLVRNLPGPLAFRLAADVLTAPLRRPRADTFAEVVRCGLGPTMYECFYAPYANKIWAVPPEQLSGSLARRRVSARSGVDLLRRLRPRDPEAGTFLYPRHGFGEIVERIAEAAVAAGAELRLGEPVTAVGRDGLVQAGDRKVRAGHVLSTLPLPVLTRLADPPAPTDVQRAAAALQYRALVLLYVVLDRAAYTRFDAHYFPGPETAAARVSEPKRYRDGTGADPVDRTVLCVELPCSVGDATWTARPRALADRTMIELSRLGLPAAEAVDAEVRRIPRAYPVYRVGFEAFFARLDTWASSLPRVVTLGRQGLFAHDNTHHALAMGRAAADAFGAGGRFDRAAWSEARAGFRSHVVED